MRAHIWIDLGSLLWCYMKITLKIMWLSADFREVSFLDLQWAVEQSETRFSCMPGSLFKLKKAIFRERQLPVYQCANLTSIEFLLCCRRGVFSSTLPFLSTNSLVERKEYRISNSGNYVWILVLPFPSCVTSSEFFSCCEPWVPHP